MNILIAKSVLLQSCTTSPTRYGGTDGESTYEDERSKLSDRRLWHRSRAANLLRSFREETVLEQLISYGPVQASLSIE